MLHQLNWSIYRVQRGRCTFPATLPSDPSLQTYGPDKYRHTIGDVILRDGMNLNQELVKDGWCWWYRKYAALDMELEELEKFTRDGFFALLMAHFEKEGSKEAAIPKISQETLAEMIGTTPSWVSFFLNRFRKLGFVHYDDRLHVHRSLLNVVLHDWRPSYG